MFTFAMNSKPTFVWVHSERGGLLGHFVQRRMPCLAALDAVALRVGDLIRVILSRETWERVAPQ
jgi:hypothetical protein